MYLGSTIKGDSPHGLYLENCPNVQYGFFGHLEVISREGARVLTSNLGECHTQFAPCANDRCDWTWMLGARISSPSAAWTTTMWTEWKHLTGRRRCLRSGQTRGREEEQEVACQGLLAAENSYISPLQEARGVHEVFESDLWPCFCLGARVAFFLA